MIFIEAYLHPRVVKTVVPKNLVKCGDPEISK